MAKINKKVMKNYLKPKLMNSDENGVRVKIYITGHMIGAGKMELFNLVNKHGSLWGRGVWCVCVAQNSQCLKSLKLNVK